MLVIIRLRQPRSDLTLSLVVATPGYTRQEQGRSPLDRQTQAAGHRNHPQWKPPPGKDGARPWQVSGRLPLELPSLSATL